MSEIGLPTLNYQPVRDVDEVKEIVQLGPDFQGNFAGNFENLYKALANSSALVRGNFVFPSGERSGVHIKYSEIRAMARFQRPFADAVVSDLQSRGVEYNFSIGGEGASQAFAVAVEREFEYSNLGSFGHVVIKRNKDFVLNSSANYIPPISEGRKFLFFHAHSFGLEEDLSRLHGLVNSLEGASIEGGYVLATRSSDRINDLSEDLGVGLSHVFDIKDVSPDESFEEIDVVREGLF